MGGVGGALGSMASSVGSGIAAGAEAVGEFGGGAIDFVSGAAKNGANFIGGNVVSPVMDSAKEAGQEAFDGAKDFFAQGWENAKNDFGEKLDGIVVKDTKGDIDGWKTAGNVAYHGSKALLAAGFAGGNKGGVGQVPPDHSQDQSDPVQQADTAIAKNAEEELNKLRSKINA